MKKSLLKKSIYILLLVVCILFIMSVKTNAATLSVSTSKSTVTEGETFTVTITVSGGAGYVSASATNGTGRLNSTFLDNSSTTFSCTAGSAGTLKISASGVIADYTTEDDENKSATKSITVKEEKPVVKDPVVNDKPAEKPSNTTKPTPNVKPVETPKSSDNTLSELTVKEGEVSPVFEKNIKEYTLTIPYELTEVNVTAKASDSKATVEIEGNKDLKEGENTVTVKVTAENGSVANYIIKVTRKRIPVALKSLIIRYENQEGQIIEMPLNPAFNFDTLEYTLQDLEYWVEKLSVEAIANIEGATIDIQGAETLQTGENIITITVRVLEENTPEGEEPKEETITYTIKVNKIEEPTIMAKTSNWFKGIMGTVGTWFNNNQTKIILGSLALCIVALIGLSIYIVVDYNKYKDVISKVKKVTEINANTEILEGVEQSSNINEPEIAENNDKDDKPKRGKHF